MNPEMIVPTAGLLGLFIVFAGLYAFFYALGRMRDSHLLRMTGYANYAAQWATVIMIWTVTPLDLPWKILLAGTAVVCSAIPKLSWYYIQDLHHHAPGD